MNVRKLLEVPIKIFSFKLNKAQVFKNGVNGEIGLDALNMYSLY